jgi:hypothetical protein
MGEDFWGGMRLSSANSKFDGGIADVVMNEPGNRPHLDMYPA